MGHLEKIRDILYRQQGSEPKTGAEFGAPERPVLDVPAGWPEQSGPFSILERAWKRNFFRPRRSFDAVLAIAGIAAALLIGFFGYLYFFAGRDVRMEVVGPAEITAGEPARFTIRISNRGRVAIKEGVATLTFGQGVIGDDPAASPFETLRERLEIPDIPAGGEFQKDVSVTALGASGEEKSVEGFFVYRPENLQSQLTRTSEFRARIIRVPLAIAVDAPEEVSSGQDLTLQAGVDSELGAPIRDLVLGVDFPRGFEFGSADPALVDPAETVWPLGELKPGESKKVVLKGVIRGDPREAKEFHFRLGRYDSANKKWITIAEYGQGPKIASPFLFVQTSVDGKREGVLLPGARVEGAVFFKNNLSQKLQNAVITLSFPEKFVDLGTIRAEQGFYDATRRMLVWDSGSTERLRELDPGEEGTLAFSFVLKSALPMRSFSDKNFSFPFSAAIDSVSPPPDFRGVSLAFRDIANFKIESRLVLAARATYYDSPVENSGPLPPRVRKRTTYTIWLQTTNGSNDLKNVEVKTQLSGNVEWVKGISADRGALEYSAAGREVLWHVRELPAGTGGLRSPAGAAFQVAFTPADNQSGSEANLLEGVFAEGEDTFTRNTVNAHTAPLTIQLGTDSRSGSGDWIVQP